MKAGKIQLKDLAEAMSMRFQPVCLSVSEDVMDEDESVYYNADCDFVRSQRCNNKDFEGLIKEYGDYYVWDIGLYKSDFGDSYIQVSVIKNRAVHIFK